MPQFSDQHSPNKPTRPLTYIIIPILALFAVFSVVVFFFCIRRRRARERETTIELGRGRWVRRDGVLVWMRRDGTMRNSRRNPSGGADSPEGLNELGEAPPPYLVRKLSAEGEVVASEGSTELRDLEEGRRPPVYISEPPPAVTTDSRRTEA
ncbi:hypothetical protein TRIATDRAFT_49033 [Trichoderma atroviride IMI 206040]|uniref:Transmembrane protein n=1 Tax=Hypocrea atroviridis (strain ATCC 20476 / IMI 206040) TaxID=452589 RepID=G9PBD7_HYPAI|nr:uncharacterized protein TRIATDRAFT_49033 [Trichoderma atroviride IMI 206040]EHK39684.1 hypothetical protein TRIATDRAFT_49033 [Trichoderma atroviride IMI 206040]